MKTVCRVLNASLKSVKRHQKSEGRKRADHYRKQQDQHLLAEIRKVIDERITYGYRRTTALIKRARAEATEAPVNAKRVYRVMRQNGLLMQKSGSKRTLTHQGKVMTLASNVRWCSDVFTIVCWNGERVQVIFSLDCCDREVIAWHATTGAVTGEMVRDLMLRTVEARFGAGTAVVPRPVQWLSDNGPPYTANETLRFGAQLGLEVCTTPAYSPQSNGMAEVLVKTFKRDYVYVNQLPSAAAVLNQLPAWFEDYCEYGPHKGLKLLSPRQFRQTQVGRQDGPDNNKPAEACSQSRAAQEAAERMRGAPLTASDSGGFLTLN